MNAIVGIIAFLEKCVQLATNTRCGHIDMKARSFATYNVSVRGSDSQTGPVLASGNTVVTAANIRKRAQIEENLGGIAGG